MEALWADVKVGEEPEMGRSGGPGVEAPFVELIVVRGLKVTVLGDRCRWCDVVLNDPDG